MTDSPEEHVADQIWDILSEESPRYTDIPKLFASVPDLDVDLVQDIIEGWSDEMINKWYEAQAFLEQWGKVLQAMVADFDDDEEEEE